MGLINYTKPTDGSTIDAADVTNPLDTIYAEFNGNIDNANIKSGAAIASSKIASDGGTMTVILSLPYKFSAYRNAAANTGNGAFAVIAHDTELFDSNNNFVSGVYTAPISGYYQFDACMSVGSDNVDTALGLFVNGTEVIRGSQGTYGAVSASFTVSGLVQLTAGQTVDVRAFAASTKALNVGSAAQNRFSGFLVSA